MSEKGPVFLQAVLYFCRTTKIRKRPVFLQTVLYSYRTIEKTSLPFVFQQTRNDGLDPLGTNRQIAQKLFQTSYTARS